MSQQLIELAEATPADKFAWRPAAGVRSTSQVYMHTAMSNFYLLSVTPPTEHEINNHRAQHDLQRDVCAGKERGPFNWRSPVRGRFWAY